MVTLLFWFLRVGWVLTLLPWAFFALGTVFTHADDSFILSYPGALLVVIIIAESLRGSGYQKTGLMVGAAPLLLVGLFLYMLSSEPTDSFLGVAREGPFTEHWDNGQIKAEGTWVRHQSTSGNHTHTNVTTNRPHATYDGRLTMWHSNGQKALEGDYIDGEENGAWTTWHPNGQVKSQGHYVSVNAQRGRNGTSSGTKIDDWATWYASGAKESEESYRYQSGEAGYIMKVGTWATWFENGGRKTEAVYVDDLAERETTWRADGQKWDETLYQDESRVKTSWYENGQKSNEMRFADGDLAEETSWRDDGSMISKTIWLVTARADGVSRYQFRWKESFQQWYENGQMSLEERFASSDGDGVRTTWHESGQQKFQANFLGGDITGPVIAWDGDGTKIFQAPVNSQAATDGDENPSCYGRHESQDDWLPKTEYTNDNLKEELRESVGDRYSRDQHGDKYHCFLLDACSGGRGLYQEKYCAKWALSRESEAIPWVEE